jgi:hypothetical protein
MRRVIVEFKKLNDEIMNLLAEKFPYGYDDDDIITFKNMHGEEIEAVEVRTEDTIYLVKVGKRLKAAMEDFDDDDDDNDDDDVEVVVDDQEFDTDDEISPDEDDDLDLE